jgi:hypothetical protein
MNRLEFHDWDDQKYIFHHRSETTLQIMLHVFLHVCPSLDSFVISVAPLSSGKKIHCQGNMAPFSIPL